MSLAISFLFPFILFLFSFYLFAFAFDFALVVFFISDCCFFLLFISHFPSIRRLFARRRKIETNFIYSCCYWCASANRIENLDPNKTNFFSLCIYSKERSKRAIWTNKQITLSRSHLGVLWAIQIYFSVHKSFALVVFYCHFALVVIF